MVEHTPVARFFGYAMIAVGALMALLSGGCTLIGLYTFVHDRAFSMVGVALLVGLPFIGIGMGLFVGGRSMVREKQPKQPPGDVF